MVVMECGAVLCTKRSSCDFPQDGSPTSRMLMSLYLGRKIEKREENGQELQPQMR